MTNRIDTRFSGLSGSGRKALVGYFTAGDPDLARSEKDIRIALRNGVDILELGVPFSDPTADGPTIQAANQRALASGVRLADVISMAKRLRGDFETPILLFGYANPLMAYGYERVCRDAAAAGVDGLLVVDMPFEESPELSTFAEAAGLYLIPLIAPTTPENRAAAILKQAKGFVYYIRLTGITGVRSGAYSGAVGHVGMLRKHTNLPIVVGFGISNGPQAREAAACADGVVVGSALLQAAQCGRLECLVIELRRALD